MTRSWAGSSGSHDGPDRQTALAASQWLCHLRENAGDAAGAIAAAQRTLALGRDDDGPWAAAMPRTMLAQLAMHVGDRGAAVEHASAALPVMRRLGASDDEMQLRSLLVLCAIADGRLADAKDELNRIDPVGDATAMFGAGSMRLVCEAELALASGDYATGLRLHREAATRMRDDPASGSRHDRAGALGAVRRLGRAERARPLRGRATTRRSAARCS